MRKSKNTQIIGTVITVIILLLLVFLTNLESSEGTYIKTLGNKIVKPINNIYNKIFKRNIRVGDFKNIGEFEKSYNDLRNENEELKSQLQSLSLLQAENETLSELLNLKQKYNTFETTPAQIINKSSNNYMANIVINVGRNEGIEEDMAVVTSEGLLGRISEVSLENSKVETIFDPASKVTVNVGAKKESVILQGSIDSEEKLLINLIPQNFEITTEEQVYTSGIGGIYPKGIYVGSVDEVFFPPNISERYAIINPGTDYKSVEKVLVIKK